MERLVPDPAAMAMATELFPIAMGTPGGGQWAIQRQSLLNTLPLVELRERRPEFGVLGYILQLIDGHHENCPFLPWKSLLA